MKALSILQPYATMIALGEKLVENRTWRTHYRGPLAIHAGQSDRLVKYDPTLRFEFGAVVAVCILVDCVRVETVRSGEAGKRFPWLTRSYRHAIGPWCWILSKVRPIKPYPVRGRLGLFEVPDEVVDRPSRYPLRRSPGRGRR